LFEDIHAENNASLVYVDGGGFITLENTNVKNGYAKYAGGIYVKGGVCSLDGYIEECYIFVNDIIVVVVVVVFI
jgi:hypothetical protein